MRLTRFMQESGFKVLAMARLSQCEYSIVLYLLNSNAAGLSEVITTRTELASLIGYNEDDLNEAISSLTGRNIIKVKSRSSNHPNSQSMSICFQFETDKWHLDFDQDVTTQDAIVFPFRRSGIKKFAVVDGQRKKAESQNAKKSTHQRIIDAFSHGRTLTDEEIDQAAVTTKTLLETHPVDQILLYLKHFGLRIPSLSLLASSWQHYQEAFEQETQKVDMLEARQKHHELDEKLRVSVQVWIDDAEEKNLSSEEVGVLQILLKHNHPRRQLFWAYQLRSRYQGLADFFKDNSAIMIPITTTGMLVKKH